MQRRKIIVNNDTYETLEAVRKTFNDAAPRKDVVSDDLILMAAFSALAEKMYNAKKNRKEE